MVMRGMGCLELVIDGLEPSTDATLEERQVFKSSQHGKSSYPNAYSGNQQTNLSVVVHQLRTLFNLVSTYSLSTSFNDFIEQYETEWTRLYSLTTTADEYRKYLRNFLD
ncbi:hypothetical protein L211DRAFT_554929 [Terfezia boudieri ATCC MYA-4762]|uniref:Uncharacterized protein n=1 Tax=Terfezia boudieri ATCC MYA-4762 TaxID=1051890 RepID=A0A3N4M3N9_9PEZI|nr:hypothetical protein L211DRAFT_554929 [Terfezia boudieri ATCC MYA-4762]